MGMSSASAVAETEGSCCWCWCWSSCAGFRIEEMELRRVTSGESSVVKVVSWVAE